MDPSLFQQLLIDSEAFGETLQMIGSFIKMLFDHC